MGEKVGYTLKMFLTNYKKKTNAFKFIIWSVIVTLFFRTHMMQWSRDKLFMFLSQTVEILRFYHDSVGISYKVVVKVKIDFFDLG